MNKLGYIKTLVTSFCITFVTCLLYGLFVYFSFIGGLTRTFADNTISEMMGQEIALERQKGHQVELFSYELEYMRQFKNSSEKQEQLKKIYNEIFYIFVLLSIMLLLTLMLVRGWSILKIKVKELKKELIPNLENGIQTQNIQWYRGVETYSYGFAVKRIILGTNYFLAQKNKKKQAFIINHELAHLKFRDSIIKNLIININKFYLPIFFFVTWFSVFLSASRNIVLFAISKNQDITPTQLYLVASFAIFPLIFLFLLWKSFKITGKWFSYAKEYLCDKYASIMTDNYILDDLHKLKQDEHHPGGQDRVKFINGNNRILDIFPFFFMCIVLLNLNFEPIIIPNHNFYVAILIIAWFFSILDILYLKLHELRTSKLLLLLGIITMFIFWNAIIFKMHSKNNSFYFNINVYLENIFINILMLILIVSYFSIYQVILKSSKSHLK